MKIMHNNKGMALVTALMLTLISLTIVMYLLYMVTAGVKQSGAGKRYKTALEASYGGVDIMTKELVPAMFSILSNPANSGTLDTLFKANFPMLNGLQTSGNVCLQEKLTKPPEQWSVSCSKTMDPKAGFDVSINLNSSVSDPYIVYSKIVDSACSDKRPYPDGKCTGSDLSGIDYLDAGTSVSGSSSGVTTKPMPAIYRIEVRAERASNPQEKSNLSLLYAY